MTPRRHSFPVPNTVGAPGTHEIVFYDWGDVNAQRVVVCVHGLTRNARDFDALAESLAATGRRVFSLNMAGRGESAWLADPMGYNYFSYVADCLAVMDNFHLRGIEWIGTSMGGVIGMMLASANPGRIRKLVLNDIGIHLPATALQRIFSYIQSRPAAFANKTEADAHLRDVFAPFGIVDTPYWPGFVDSSLLPNKDGSYRYACDPAIAVPLAAASQNFTQVQDVNLADIWAPVDIPTLILRGAESDILSEDTIRSMRVTNPRTESVTIEGVGHAPALVDAHQIGIITQWLNGYNAQMLAVGL